MGRWLGVGADSRLTLHMSKFERQLFAGSKLQIKSANEKIYHREPQKDGKALGPDQT